MRMAIIKAIVVAAALFAVIAPVRAEIRILASPGGQVGPFLDLFDRVRQSGERVVIDGPCLSACTLVLMTIPEERICVTRRAVLGFHAARSIDRRGRMLRNRKPRARCRKPIRRRCGLDQPPRRTDLADVAVARARTRRDLSAVQVVLQGGQRRTRAVPTIFLRGANGGHASLCPPYDLAVYPRAVLPDLILKSASSRVSKDEWHQRGLMVRDGATRLLTMRIGELTCLPSGN